ncbi:MAG TPA: hypothetical protein VEB65_08845 [Solirubrobacterales bacterium]|nr:hypothetical protein [Solirubrobacterales bacterium]
MKVRNIARAAAIVLAVCGLLAATAGAAGKEGWGPQKDYVGRYHVKVTKGGKLGVRGGQLNLFIQEEFPGSLQPAGILKLTTRAGRIDLVYLTDLHHRGTGRGAEIHGGAFIGPKIGTFAGTQRKPGRIRATLHTRGLGTVKALFVRFSTKPTQ